MTNYYTNRTDSWTIAITGNIVSGDTFAAKETIKKLLNGRWDGDRKLWIIDTNKIEAATKSITGLYDASEAQIAALTGKNIAPRRAGTYVAADGVRVCSKCHTVCYGDCEAN